MSILQTVDLKKDYGEEPNITHALNGIQFEVDKNPWYRQERLRMAGAEVLDMTP